MFHHNLHSYWHPPLIFSIRIINEPLLTQLILVSPIYFVFSFIMRIAHVWHSLSTNIQAPHFAQCMTGSCVSVASAKFFVPMAWHLRHWKTLNPSWESYPSSHINSELAEQKLHLNLTKFPPWTLRASITFKIIALSASCNQVCRQIRSSMISRNDMIYLIGCLTTISASPAISFQHPPPCHFVWHWPSWFWIPVRSFGWFFPLPDSTFRSLNINRVRCAT